MLLRVARRDTQERAPPLLRLPRFRSCPTATAPRG